MIVVNLRQWAIANGLHPQTAYKWFRDGKLPVPAYRAGNLILIGDPERPVSPAGSPAVSNTVVYARVSSADQKSDLDRQVARVVMWATGSGRTVSQVVTEVGSGLNGKRRKLNSLLADVSVTEIVVEHRDRLTRFGFEYLSSALAASGRTITVVDDGDVADDLVRDMTEVLTSLCARVYGRRGAANRARAALSALAQDPDQR